MPSPEPFQYAIVRIVPRIERGESINAGVVLFCRPRRFLGARTALDEARLAALAPGLDPGTVRPHLEAIERIAAGDGRAGPIAALPRHDTVDLLCVPEQALVSATALQRRLWSDS